MKKDEHVSEEQLNAFTDGELDTEEESRIFELCDESPELDARLCQQRKLKEMVQHAYRNVPQAERRSRSMRAQADACLDVAAAAIFLLATGMVVGWFTSLAMGPGQDAVQMATGFNSCNTGAIRYLLASCDEIGSSAHAGWHYAVPTS